MAKLTFFNDVQNAFVIKILMTKAMQNAVLNVIQNIMKNSILNSILIPKASPLCEFW